MHINTLDTSMAYYDSTKNAWRAVGVLQGVVCQFVEEHKVNADSRSP